MAKVNAGTSPELQTEIAVWLRRLADEIERGERVITTLNAQNDLVRDLDRERAEGGVYAMYRGTGIVKVSFQVREVGVQPATIDERMATPNHLQV